MSVSRLNDVPRVSIVFVFLLRDFSCSLWKSAVNCCNVLCCVRSAVCVVAIGVRLLLDVGAVRGCAVVVSLFVLGRGLLSACAGSLILLLDKTHVPQTMV